MRVGIAEQGLLIDDRHTFEIVRQQSKVKLKKHIRTNTQSAFNETFDHALNGLLIEEPFGLKDNNCPVSDGLGTEKSFVDTKNY